MMRTLAIGTRCIALLAILGCATTLWGGGSPLGYVRTHTIQNLAPSPSKYLGHYLSVDAAGGTSLSSQTADEDNNSRWELKYLFWKERGYLAHGIVQRGDNAHNGKFLAIDPKTGALTYTAEAVPTARWLVRYAGKYHGWDAYTMQNLGVNGEFDMTYIAIDEATGEVKLSAKPVPGAHWLIDSAPYLPAETLFVQ
jgi:hypothetical protein